MKPTEAELQKVELCERKGISRHVERTELEKMTGSGSHLRATLNIQDHCDNSQSLFQSDVNLKKKCAFTLAETYNRGQDGRRSGGQACHSETIIDGTELKEPEVQNLPKFQATLKQVQSDVNFERKCAFTFAETLITLVIIGIVAALTIPNLIIKYQKDQAVTRLKKVYSTLSQTTNRAISDYGPINTWNIGEHGNVDDTILFLNTYLIPYLNVSKKPFYYGLCDYTYNDGSKITTCRYVKFYLTDGASIRASIYNSQYNGMGLTKLLQVVVDSNGDKKPNKIGRDVFLFNYWISAESGGLKSCCVGKFTTQYMGSSRDWLLKQLNQWKHEPVISPQLYATLMMQDDWQILDDYPW